MSFIRLDQPRSADPMLEQSASEKSASLNDSLDLVRRQLCSDSSFGDHLLMLPWNQHDQYQRLRETSALGRIFRAANSLHDHIDTVVVVGHRQQTGICRAIMQACCDPYHNEMDRAARGSKPRMYFADASYDTDSLAALLHRLESSSRTNGDSGQGEPGQRFAPDRLR